MNNPLAQMLPSGYRSGDLIAFGAGIVGTPIGCVVCHTMIWTGQRAAQLADGSGWAMLGCLASMKPASEGVTP